MKNRTPLGGSTGLTLVELLVTLTIFGILISMASSDASDVRQRESIDSTAQQFFNSIQFTQDYARHLSTPSALCAGTPADQCQSTDWNSGWTLFRSNQQNEAAPLEAIRTIEAPRRGVHLSVSGLNTPGRFIVSGEGYVLSSNSTISAVVCTRTQTYNATLTIDKAQTKIENNFNASTESETCQNEAS